VLSKIIKANAAENFADSNRTRRVLGATDPSERKRTEVCGMNREAGVLSKIIKAPFLNRPAMARLRFVETDEERERLSKLRPRRIRLGAAQGAKQIG
jgi:hypothetical protein